MKFKNHNRIFRGIVLCLVLFSFSLSVLTPFAFASSTLFYAQVNVSTLNVRTGPGLSYNVVYSAGKGEILRLTGQVDFADDYTWYELADTGFWIAETGGWTFVSTSVYEDNIAAYDAYGSLAWQHTCVGDSPDWYYHIEVYNEGYSVRCDCGWWEQRIIPSQYDSDGNVILCFIGLDTNNDERVDLKPGQSKKLFNRSNTDLRPYTILEFLDNPNVDTPTVTLTFATADNDLIERYTFIWWVEVHVEAYGVVMEGMDGTKKIHYVDGNFLLYDRADGLFLADNIRKYETLKQYNGREYIQIAERHMEFFFTLEPPGEGDLGPVEWVTHVVRSLTDFLAQILDFFGLSFIFTHEDSPFRFLIGG